MSDMMCVNIAQLLRKQTIITSSQFSFSSYLHMFVIFIKSSKKVSVLSILQKKNDFGRSLQKLVADKHVLAFGFIQLNTKSCRKFSKITLAIPAATTEYVMYGGIFQRLLTSSHVYCMLHTHYTCTM